MVSAVGMGVTPDTMLSIIMFGIMVRPVRILAAVAVALAGTIAGLAQTPPPGPPFDPSKHANPIITFVESKDFKPIVSDQVKKEAGIDLIGISKAEGQRELLQIADGRFAKNMSILSIRTDVTYYPVVLQKFKLTSGSEVVLYSFRFPKVALPPDFTRLVLNEAAIEKKKRPSEMRLGGMKPETFEIRGTRALLFENEGQTTVYWQEEGVAYTATSSLPQKELFAVIESLL
jgi:Domain of unknown function (DUF4367)